MIQYKKFSLDNGLKLIVHRDSSTPLVAVNILYNVGSRNESKDKTGFAHLFEHLMFSGSKHVEDFDIPIQMAGGENNAFTNSDITNFYNLVPKKNLETVFWLESDRMAYLDINQESLDIQKKVVVEEFKEVCLNQPYGDMWHHMSSVAYKKHPYNWPTIGKDFSHIEEASLADVQSFFDQYYNPNNAIITVAGDIDENECYDMVNKYFGWIQNKEAVSKKSGWDSEPVQKKLRQKILNSNVPAEAMYMGFHMSDRLDQQYYVTDLITDILSNGRSSRFFKNLFKGTQLFTTIDAYVSGTFDPGLLMVEAKLNTGAELEESKALIWKELDIVKNQLIDKDELQKLLNKLESAQVYSEVNILTKAINLGYYTSLGETELINNQMSKYQEVNIESIRQTANDLLRIENCTEIIYKPLVHES